MDTKLLGWRVQLGTGAILTSMAVMAMRTDIINNWDYGRSISFELASILVLAAAGVVVLPTASALLGWSLHLRVTTAICVALTVWSAINAYSTKQGAQIMDAQTKMHHYETALADENAARATLARITEVGDAGELERMRATASASFAKLCRKRKSDDCKAAEAEVKTLTMRLSDAKARDKVQEALKLAKAGTDEGPAEPNMVATVIADHIGADTIKVARAIALVLTGLGIAVTQLVALLAGQGAKLIAAGWLARPKCSNAKRDEKRASPNGEPQCGMRQTTSTNVVRLDAAKHSVKSWLEMATSRGGDMRGGEALKAYKRYAGRMAKGMSAGDFRQLLIELLGPAAITNRTSGYVVVGRCLNTQARVINVAP